MEFGYIYIIKNNVNEKCYVGKTEKPVEKRWKEHLYNVGRRKQVLYLAMMKHGVENFFIKTLERVEKEKLNEREVFWINHLKTKSPNGYNVTIGGDFGTGNPMHDPEIALKISKRFKGELNPSKRPEVKEKIRKSQTGRKASDKTKEKMKNNPNRKYWMGKKRPLDTRRKISKNHGCRGKFGALNPNSKKVAKLDIHTNEIIEIYGSFKEAEKWVKKFVKPTAHYSSISKCCNGKQKTSFGYKWSYVDKV